MTNCSFGVTVAHLILIQIVGVQIPERVLMVLWCNGIAHEATDFVVWVRILMRPQYGERSLVGRALVCGASCRGFESHRSHNLTIGYIYIILLRY